ncbi:MAG: hypothetical protein GX580_10750, partial [Candidatus Hydrogenedens sp.]|nr:hypothetical protein [Candidatus Hydrogenedens sp.]
MMNKTPPAPGPRPPALDAKPVYELRAQGMGGGQIALEIWQLPSPATPRLVGRERTAGLQGRALEIVEA